MTEKLWFAAKRYGYGWYPATWEGWAVTLGYVVLLLLPLLVIAAMGFKKDLGLTFTIFYLPYVGILVWLLLWICVKKGEPARWRWGK